MSGGAFEYQDRNIRYIGQEMQYRADVNEVRCEYGANAASALRELGQFLIDIGDTVYEADLYLSGDASEARFLAAFIKWKEGLNGK